MGARAQAILPLALVVGVLSFLWTEFSLNATFHLITTQDKVLGGPLGQPDQFHFILPVAFVSWGLFFCAGGDNAAFGKIAISSLFGCVAALITMYLAYKTASFPDFWGIALWVGIAAFVLVAILIAGDWYYVAGTFPAFASVFLWWIATGLDGWVTGKSETYNLANFTAKSNGSGAFGGFISTSFYMVAVNVFVTLICGVVLGIVSAKVAAAITPKAKEA